MTRNATAPNLRDRIELRTNDVLDSAPSTIPAAQRIREIVNSADDALRDGDLDHFLAIYESLRISPPLDRIAAFADNALVEGRFGDALYAYALCGARPNEYYLELCAHAASDSATAKRAGYLARHGRGVKRS